MELLSQFFIEKNHSVEHFFVSSFFVELDVDLIVFFPADQPADLPIGNKVVDVHHELFVDKVAFVQEEEHVLVASTRLVHEIEHVSSEIFLRVFLRNLDGSEETFGHGCG
jgi:hypothetical protein